MASISHDQIILIIGGLLPLIVSNVLHMVLVKKNGLSFLSIPLQSTWFGPNKTLRGFVFVPVVNGIVYLIINWPGGWLLSGLSPECELSPKINICDITFLNNIFMQATIGAVYGLFYMLFELPNSWIKRRMGIMAGESSKRFRWFFTLLDKTDSAIGVSLLFGFLSDTHFNIEMMLKFFVCASLLHFSISGLLVLSKIKKSF
jgi:CDP-diacylglycerol--serine O-phosphatidyltransferase